MKRGSVQLAVPPVTPVVKGVLILSAVLFLLQQSLETFAHIPVSAYLGFAPARLLHGWLWQPFTYSFFHASLFHLLFNLLVIWTVGSELEGLWGARTFVAFYFVSALGAALMHGLFSLVGIGPGAYSPVIGSSGVVYGLLLAYGILFGERVMYFFLLFPLQARYFVMVLGAVELVSSVFQGSDGVAHLAHLGGMVAGFFFLVAMAKWRARQKFLAAKGHVDQERKKRLKKAGHLRLVEGGEDEEDGPKHWN